MAFAALHCIDSVRRLVAEWKRIAKSAPQADYGAKLREGILVANVAATVGCCNAWSPRRLSTGDTGYLGA